MKSKRKKDPILLETIRGLECLGCLNPPSNDAHHITSVGAGGDDRFDNVMSLCRNCHQKWHLKGPGYMVEHHPAIKHWLEITGRTDVFERIKKSTSSM